MKRCEKFLTGKKAAIGFGCPKIDNQEERKRIIKGSTTEELEKMMKEIKRELYLRKLLGTK